MNLLLHGIGTPSGESPDRGQGRLDRRPGERYSGRAVKSAVRPQVVADNDRRGRRRRPRGASRYERQDFWVTTSNKQLNFLQHIATILDIHGRAAVVVPDNVLFEGGAGETLRRRMLQEFDVHTMLRLPTGIFYAQASRRTCCSSTRSPRARAAVDHHAVDL